MASELEVGALLGPLPVRQSPSNSPSTSPNELSVTPPALASTASAAHPTTPLHRPVEPASVPPSLSTPTLPPLEEPELERALEEVAAWTLDEVATEVVLDSHREFRLGLGFLQDKPELSETPLPRRKPPNSQSQRPQIRPHRICTTPGLDIFGQSPAVNSKVGRNLECWCPACNRQMAAARFAPHLEKCLGMGRNSFRQANRRLASSTAAPANPLQGRGARSVPSPDLDSDSEAGSGDEFRPGGELEEEEEEDEDWLDVRHRRRPRRRLPPAASSSARRPARKTPVPVVVAPVPVVPAAADEEPDLFGALIPDLFPARKPTSGKNVSELSDSSRDAFEEFPAPPPPKTQATDPFLLDPN